MYWAFHVPMIRNHCFRSGNYGFRIVIWKEERINEEKHFYSVVYHPDVYHA